MSGGAHIPHGGHSGHQHEKQIGLVIAVIAVIMAIIGAFAKDAANTRITAEVRASNQYAWYQSKRIRVAMNDLTIKQLDIQLQGPNVTDAQKESIAKLQGSLKKKNDEYEVENKEILAEADKLKAQAEDAAHKYHGYEQAEIFLQIAVVLCSVTLLTHSMIFLYGGIALTAIGLLVGGKAYLGGHHEPHAEEAAKPAMTTTQPTPPKAH
jgi:hypothetical protein